jgi:hypothetical protein
VSTKSIGKSLGLDPDDPQVLAALQDVTTITSLIAALVARRTQLGLSVEQVAVAMEMPLSEVRDFERLGADPRMSSLMGYARAVGVSVEIDAHPAEDTR